MHSIVQDVVARSAQQQMPIFYFSSRHSLSRCLIEMTQDGAQQGLRGVT